MPRIAFAYGARLSAFESKTGRIGLKEGRIRPETGVPKGDFSRETGIPGQWKIK
jgi:hypothetical protein